MNTIFIVSIGEYSDCRNVAAFDSEYEDDADKMAELIGGDVEEFELNTLIPKDPGLDFFWVYMRKNGDFKCHQKSRLDEDGNRRMEEMYLQTKKDFPRERRSYWQLHGGVYAESEEHVKRYVNELRRQILADQRPPSVDMGKN